MLRDEATRAAQAEGRAKTAPRPRSRGRKTPL
jgi:hypothetical protein